MAKALVAATLLLALVPFAPPAAAAHEYELSVWFNWDKTSLDVLIVAVQDPILGAIILDAIASWEEGIAHFSPALGDALELRVYWPSRDPVPPPAFAADIVVLPQGTFATWTDGTDQFGPNMPDCYAFAPFTILEAYATVAHEFGHCLGLAHVFEHGVEYAPAKDIMGLGDVPGNHACPSNLDVRVLDMVYAGRTGTVTMASSDYAQAPC